MNRFILLACVVAAGCGVKGHQPKYDETVYVDKGFYKGHWATIRGENSTFDFYTAQLDDSTIVTLDAGEFISKEEYDAQNPNER